MRVSSVDMRDSWAEEEAHHVDEKAGICAQPTVVVGLQLLGHIVTAKISSPLRVLDWFISAEATRLGGRMCDVSVQEHSSP